MSVTYLSLHRVPSGYSLVSETDSPVALEPYGNGVRSLVQALAKASDTYKRHLGHLSASHGSLADLPEIHKHGRDTAGPTFSGEAKCGRDTAGPTFSIEERCGRDTAGPTFSIEERCGRDTAGPTFSIEERCGRDTAGPTFSIEERCGRDTAGPTFSIEEHTGRRTAGPTFSEDETPEVGTSRKPDLVSKIRLPVDRDDDELSIGIVSPKKMVGSHAATQAHDRPLARQKIAVLPSGGTPSLTRKGMEQLLGFLRVARGVAAISCAQQHFEVDSILSGARGCLYGRSVSPMTPLRVS